MSEASTESAPVGATESVRHWGPYSMVRYLTAGGMADLYLAERKGDETHEPIVVKTIQSRYADMTRVVKMFLDEGRIAQALQHPNVVRTLDVGFDQGSYYIAMEYIPGRDLLAVCRRAIEVRNFLPRALAVGLLVQVLRGLGFAHEKRGADGELLRVVHCDVSPGNIVLSWGGTAKVVDFGIARATIAMRAEDHSVAGKYNYMAPEQVKGEAVDARADVFAVGILLWELTVGKRLFRGRPEQVMRLVVDEPIPTPSSVRADYPPALEAIVMRALERDLARRYPTARALREALSAWLASEQLSAGKRELASFLRQIFGAAPRDIGAGAAEYGDLAEGDELQLEKSGAWVLDRPLVVDAEDPEDALSTEPSTDASTATSIKAGSTADRATIEELNVEASPVEPPKVDSSQPAHAVSGPVSQPAPTVDEVTRPASRAAAEDTALRWARLVFALVLVATSLALYFFVVRR